MGTGKSTAGRLVAARLGLAFVDTDAVIEARAGRTIADIFAQEGEPAFRALEAAVCQEVAAGREQSRRRRAARPGTYSTRWPRQPASEPDCDLTRFCRVGRSSAAVAGSAPAQPACWRTAPPTTRVPHQIAPPTWPRDVAEIIRLCGRSFAAAPRRYPVIVAPARGGALPRSSRRGFTRARVTNTTLALYGGRWPPAARRHLITVPDGGRHKTPTRCADLR